MYNMTMNNGSVVSLSAVTKAQATNAEILFGKNAKVLIKRIDELTKIKELDTSKLEAVLDILKDTEATTAFAKKAAGKNAVTAIKNLFKAKTLVATINGLRAIKIKVTAPNAAAKVDVKPEPVAKTKGDIGIKPARVVATRVNQNAELPKVDLARITPAFMKTVTQAQTDAIADQLSKATGLKFLPIYQETNGQSSPWVFEATNPKAGYKSVSIDPPYAFHSQMRSIKWAVSAVDSRGGIYEGNELKSPTAAALAKAVKDVIGKSATKKEARTSKGKRQGKMSDLFFADTGIKRTGFKISNESADYFVLNRGNFVTFRIESIGDSWRIASSGKFHPNPKIQSFAITDKKGIASFIADHTDVAKRGAADARSEERSDIQRRQRRA